MKNQAEAKEFLTTLVEDYAASKASQSRTSMLSKGTIEGLYNFAYTFYQSGKYQDSVNFFRFLTLIDASQKRNWVGLGAALKMLQSYEKAIHAYHVGALLDERDPHILIHTAECYDSLQQMESALEYLSRAENVAQKNEEFHTLLPQLALLRDAWEMRHVEEKVS